MPTKLEQQIARAKEAAARRSKALVLRQQGRTFQEIADALGLKSHQHARQIVAQAMADTTTHGDA